MALNLEPSELHVFDKDFGALDGSAFLAGIEHIRHLGDAAELALRAERLASLPRVLPPKEPAVTSEP